MATEHLLRISWAFAERHPYLDVLFTAGALALGFFLWSEWVGDGLDVPITGVDWSRWMPVHQARLKYITEGTRLLHEGYQQYPDQIFRIPTVNQNLLMLPPKYVEELKSQPEEVLYSSQATSDYFMGTYTTLHVKAFGDVMWNTLRTQFSQEIGHQTEALDDEAKFLIREKFGSYEDWTPVQVHPVMLHLVAGLTARVSLGLPLCRDQLWLETSIGYAVCVFQAALQLKLLPRFLIRVASYINPHIRKIAQHHRNAKRILLPEIARRDAMGPQDKKSSQKDTLDWLNEFSEGSDASPDLKVHRLLVVGFGSNHTTTNHITNVIYDLAYRWDEYAAELREEIETAIREDGGVISKSTVTKLSKLDSFMKESQRLNPSSSLTFNRKLMRPHTLSDGITLPEGAYIAVASGPMALDEQYHPDPLRFDGFRFHRYRNDPKNGVPTAHQFGTTSFGSLMFGHGRFACPGRFVAGLMSKLILCEILLRYDLKLEDPSQRPRNMFFADANIPNPELKVLFRNREKR